MSEREQGPPAPPASRPPIETTRSGEPFRAYILSGGEATRAGGVNKSFIEIEGKKIIEHQLGRLSPVFGPSCGSEIVLVTDRPEDYAAYELRTICDVTEAEVPGAGDRSALRGIVTALRDNPAGWSFIIANDMPWPDAELIGRMWRRARGEDEGTTVEFRAGACLVSDSRVQPLHGIYSGALAASASLALAGGDKSLRSWIRNQPGIIQLNHESLGATQDQLALCLTNINEAPD